MLYKDRHVTESDHSGKTPKMCDEVVLENINEDDVARRVQEDPDDNEQHLEPSTPISHVRRSTRVSRLT